MHPILAVLWVIALGALGALGASAASENEVYSEKLFSGLRYHMLGPSRGGRVTAVAGHRRQPSTFYMGATGGGVWKTTDYGLSWHPISDGYFATGSIGAIRVAESNPDVVYVSTGSDGLRSNVIIGKGVYKSVDAGKSWKQLNVSIADECPAVGVPRPTGIAVDPTDGNKVWVGLEVDGVRYSTDGGETWGDIDGQIPNKDVHNMLVTAGPPKTVFTVVNDDIWRSTDDGKSWQAAHARESFPWHYPRGITAKPNDPKTVFLTLGDATPGRVGTIMRTKDAGETWQSLGFPVQPNSAMWTVSIPAAQPDLVLAASRYGYLYRSDDGGDSWRKLWRELSEVSSIMWVPL